VLEKHIEDYSHLGRTFVYDFPVKWGPPIKKSVQAFHESYVLSSSIFISAFLLEIEFVEQDCLNFAFDRVEN